MQTNLADFIKDSSDGREADAILRKCVHCGFCLATCPTYQMLDDELDSPRGRIYLIKQVLEGAEVTAKTQLHLDRCLTCRACETTCPAGVEYGRLVDIGRRVVDEQVTRPLVSYFQRWTLRKIVPRQRLFAFLFSVGRAVRRWLPPSLKKSIRVAIPSAKAWPAPRHARRMLLLDGCVQPSIAPSINTATAQVLDVLGITLIRADGQGCCGAISHHLNAHEEALNNMRQNIDAWWPHVEAGIEAIIATASGCGTMVHSYGHLLRHDEFYAKRSQRVSELFRDLSQVISAETKALSELFTQLEKQNSVRVAFQSPCSLHHGLKIRGVVEQVLVAAGYELTHVPDGHLCCGSAGTYSLLQPEISTQLRINKLRALESGQPNIIVTANIGCLIQIESGTQVPVRHWIELVAERLSSSLVES